MRGAGLQRAWPDALGVVVAALYAIPTLAYPFGRDQAIFYYIGREWLNGTLPYRDAFDLKPPAIFALHSLSIVLFGASQVSIRIMDVLCLLGLAKLTTIAVRRDQPRVPGEMGLVAVLLSVIYFSNFDFWDSAQCELWEALCIMASYVALERIRSVRKAALLAGVLASVAVLFKLTAGLMGVVLAALALSRGWGEGGSGAPVTRRVRDALLSLGLFAAGSVLPVALVLGYYAAHGALWSLQDLLGYVLHYAGNEFHADSVGERLAEYWFARSGFWLAAVLGLWLVGATAAWLRKDWRVLRGALFVLVLAAAAFESVVVQKKFFTYHWGVVVPFLVLAGAYGLAELAAVKRHVALIAGASVAAGMILSAPPWFSNRAFSYRTYITKPYWRYVTGKLPHSDFVRIFKGVSNYNYAAQEDIAAMILERAKPGDLLHVRGFELAMYALTGMRTPCRFVSELPIDDPTLFFHHEEWLGQQNQALWSTRPRFIVTFVDRPRDIALIQSKGYREVGRRGLFLLMIREQEVGPNANAVRGESG